MSRPVFAVRVAKQPKSARGVWGHAVSRKFKGCVIHLTNIIATQTHIKMYHSDGFDMLYSI
jgi:hypothetical protein